MARILYCISGLRKYGAERQLFLLIKNLHKKHEIRVVSFQGGHYEKKLWNLHVRTRVLHANNLFDAGFVYKGIVAEIKSFKPDIIHSWLPHANIMCKVVKFFSKQKFKLICSVRVTERKLWHLNLIEWITKSQADAVVTNSKATQKFLKKQCFNDVNVIYNAYS